MTQRNARRTRSSIPARSLPAALTAGLLIASGLLLAPASAAVAETTEPSADPGAGAATSCAVESAELFWGLKTSFRNYISGSIANGEWTTENGASYETPAFNWANGTGSFESDLSSGSVTFTGDVHFTGHDGLMRLDLSDPEIVFTGADSAQLIFGIGSASTAEVEITYERIAIAKVDLAGYVSLDGSALAIADASVRLTSEGADALNSDFGDYVAGDELDGLALNLVTSGCELTSSTGEQEPPAEKVTDDEKTFTPIAADEPTIPWVPIAIGGVALIVVGVTVGMLLAGRRNGPGEGASSGTSGSGASDGGGA